MTDCRSPICRLDAGRNSAQVCTRVICPEGALGFMVIASKAAIAVCSFVLVAAGGAAIVAGTGGLWQALWGGPEAKVADGSTTVEAKADTKSETNTAL